MQILITAAGSYGDIAPYTGVGARLRAAGHHVTLATHDTFAPLVRAAGLDFRSLPADPRGPRPADGQTPDPAPTTRRALMRRAAAFIRQLGTGMAEAAAPGTDLLLLSTTTAPLGAHLAEALDIPSLGLALQPTAPTGDFAPVVNGSRSLGRWGNRAAGRLSLRIVDHLHADATRDLRSRLGLPPATPRTIRRRTEAANRPVLHGFSELLVPRPRDWRPGLDIVGNWWPHLPAGSQLPATLEHFLAAGPPPVYIGFGSMAAGEGERLGALAVRALRRAKVRGILQSGWAGLTAPDATTPDVLTIDEVPHALLFPRVAAAVHHCGAGTTAAALRAGIPTVPVPVTADQPFWAARLHTRGAATPPIPFTALTRTLSPDDAATRLAAALTQATATPALRARAQHAAHRLAAEDGPAAVVGAVAGIAG
ncbi:glycosyl transferase [Streptomyces albospinus]|uniref:Glycosyl transferase n=1 Tax=Streptomyces albospinus TaxID=285515 RepID=A0ABQ2VGN5_9ACTN|nr:glycosyltransferase [Streptomyces albospinus]GGU86051.1 glycosyl transferase [Streptomyces albospinus]